MKWLAAMPGVCVIALFGASGGWALVSGRPLVWPPVAVTLPDAAAMRDYGEVMRLIGSGADANAAAPVVYGFRFDRVVTMTPLEAAVYDHDTDMLEFIEEHGALIDERTVRGLACFARHLEDRKTEAYLTSRTPAPVACDGVRLPL